MAWYIARSLETLRAQLNQLAPHRSTVSDGGIGDAAHSARLSDHNPTAAGQVCARDFTNDPAGGMPGQWLADALVRSRDPRIKYVIFNHRIIDSRAGNHPWQWMPYTGENAHEHHVHVSVFAGSLGDRTDTWHLSTADPGEDDMTPQEFLDAKVTWWDGHSAPVKDVLAEVYIAARGLRGAPAFDKQTAPVHLPTLDALTAKLDTLTAQVAALAKQLEAKP